MGRPQVVWEEMIVVLSLNTAIDRVYLVPGLRLGDVHRATEMHATAGGKGLNVARVLRRLGQEVRVVGFLGGAPRDFIINSCMELGIDQRWTETAGTSRTCVILADPETRRQTVVNETGPTVRDVEAQRLLVQLERAVRPGDLLCISGSAPPGVPDDFYAEIVREMSDVGVHVLVDVSGEALRLALGEHPWAAVPNREECAEALSIHGSAEEVARVLARHTDIALLTLGGDGVLYGANGALWRVYPPPVTAVNAVASGDSFAAGFLAGIASGLPPLEALRLAVACGASNAGRFEPLIGPPDEIQTLVGQVRIERVAGGEGA